MGNQTILTIVLIALVVALSILLVRRIVTERRQQAAIRRMSLSEFSDFLRSNSVGGNIAEVAGKVSDLLKRAFGCQLILFLRKKRRFLELNYFYGIENFDRREFRLPAERTLMKTLSAEFLPRPIDDLRQVLPAAYLVRLKELQFGLFFPVFWRENLYGVYFIKSTIETRSPSFNLMVASLAQSLAAAYHIKWHESRYEVAQNQLERARVRANAQPREGSCHSHLLELVNHRNSQTLLPKLVDSIRRDMGINRIAFLYQPKDRSGPCLIQEGVECKLNVPDRKLLDELLSAVSNGDIHSLPHLVGDRPALRQWARAITDSGLEHIAAFSPVDDSPGVLVWSGGKGSLEKRQEIAALKAHAHDLITNAESFEHIEAMSQTDGLTGLANQRYFSRRLDEEIQRARRYHRTLALIFFDMDELKVINDTYGHQAGDALLRQMGEILRKNIRSIDIIARYGGDEFCIIMPEADRSMCTRFMERLKNDVARNRFTVDGISVPLTCTVSLGGAVFPEHADDPRQLIFSADMALLKAKELGRNQAVLFDVDLAAKA